MKVEEFNKVIAKQVERSTSVLIDKAEEYATEDRLHNFRVASVLNGTSMEQALAGMMLKHTVSIYDMCRGGVACSIDLWNEKIADHINYLLLLRAIVEENSQKKHAL